MSSDADLGEYFMVGVAGIIALVLLLTSASCWAQAKEDCDRRGGVLVRGHTAWDPKCVAGRP